MPQGIPVCHTRSPHTLLDLFQELMIPGEIVPVARAARGVRIVPGQEMFFQGMSIQVGVYMRFLHCQDLALQGSSA